MTKRELNEINSLRETYHMRPIIPAKRKCLRCDEVFDSRGIHNRICPLCKANPDYGPWMDAYSLPPVIMAKIAWQLDKYEAWGFLTSDLLDTTLLDKEEI